MGKPNTLEKIEKEIVRLNPEEQLQLVEKLIHQLRKTGHRNKETYDLSRLYGLGKGIWDEDAQDYVNRAREDRL